MKKFAPAALYMLVALLGATAGYMSYRHFTGAQPKVVTTAAPAPAPQPSASATNDASSAEDTPPAIPEEVPDIELTDVGGKRHALRAIPGRTRLYNFWASWCEPCRREIPLLNTLQDAHRAEGLRIVGIAIDTREAVLSYLKATPLHYTVLVGEQGGAEAAEKFGMQLALPFTVFADEKNRIIAVKVGELHRDEADAILAHMQSLSAGKESLEAARAAIATTLRTLVIERAKQSGKT